MAGPDVFSGKMRGYAKCGHSNKIWEKKVYNQHFFVICSHLISCEVYVVNK